jgi:RNA polymerase sigma-70 factor (ECF subfamily)
MKQGLAAQRALAVLDDAQLVRRALARDAEAFRTIMQRHNRRLYRIVRSILRNDDEAEDVVQEAYVRAFTIWKSSVAIRVSGHGSPASP